MKRAVGSFFLVIMSATAAAADLARVGPFSATTFGNMPCSAEMPIVVTAATPESYSEELPALISLAAEAGQVLARKCPRLERISIDGEADFKSVFQASAAKADDWEIDVKRSFDAGKTVAASMQQQLTQSSGNAGAVGRQAPGGAGSVGGQTSPGNFFSAFDPLQNQGQPPQSGGTGGSSSPQIQPQSSGSFDASGFRRSDLIQAFYDGDMSTLRSDKEAAMFYLMPIVNAFSAPDVWFRIGLDAELLMDPELLPIMNGITMTDPNFMRSITAPGLQGLWGALQGLAQERQKNIDRGTIDPFSEMAGFNEGLMQHTTPIARTIASAKYDAKRLLHLATIDQAAFLKVYDGIREFVYSY